MCVCVFVRALLILKLFTEVKCAGNLKITVETMVESMGKIIRSREVKQKFVWRFILKVEFTCFKACIAFGVGFGGA